ncbi:ATP phosphoribosyltransferase [Caulobacter sp. SLTY]|uniref:ATP phosphoribosyltransferase n=1 Tax=Caulobacter sp. SLTY TaxID=2683262 RepID=UPI001F0F4487|nr:ATP phosphoribosyltransferase [Caulobacter sp. SLTY]
MGMSVILAIPSKGRLKEQVEGWLADAGLKLEADGGERGYRARIAGLDGLEVRLISAGEIARALSAGEVHLGVTGEDLLREQGEELEARALLLRPLGFGRADLVVAVPQSWLDVETMADLEEVAHQHLARTGRRLRVATKYVAQTRAFFARHGVGDYRIVESAGATEGAPAAGTAEVVVDITTTGATLAANHLAVLADGVILKSQAQLAAGLMADWSGDGLAVARRLLSQLEARARARRTLTLVWPAEQDAAAKAAVEGLGGQARASGLLIPRGELGAVSAALESAGVGPVTAAAPEYVFDPECPPWSDLAARVRGN